MVETTSTITATELSTPNATDSRNWKGSVHIALKFGPGCSVDLTLPLAFPSSYGKVSAQRTSATIARATATDLGGVRTYTIKLTCVTC